LALSNLGGNSVTVLLGSSGGTEQVRQNLEKANERVYGKGKVLRFYDGQSVAETEQEMAVGK